MRFIFNLPYSIVALFLGIISFPTAVSVHHRPFAIIFSVKSLWWSFHKGTRASAIGNIVFLSPTTEENDLEHELVHVTQYNRYPFIFPFLYYLESYKKGYRKNKYEEEAYAAAGNFYKEME